jgi:transposase
MALFDLSSSWLEGSQCPLAARSYSRDSKKGRLQIEYGLLTDPAGRPVAVRVFPGNTGDPAAFTQITEVVRTSSGCGTWSWPGTGARSPAPGSGP